MVNSKDLTIGKGGVVRTKTKTATVVPKPVTKVASQITNVAKSDRFNFFIKKFEERDPYYGRIITIGEGNTGKSTACIQTLPTPILLLMFDPNTEQLIPKKMIEQGLIMPIRYYGDAPDKPTGYADFKKNIFEWEADGFIKLFGSMVIDSLTGLSIAHLRDIAYKDMRTKKKVPRKNMMPQLNDYHNLKVNTIVDFLAISAFPCHVILTAHILAEREFRDDDDLIGFIRRTLNATPALQANVTQMFTDVYRSVYVPGKKAISKKVKAMPERWEWQTKTETGAYKDLPLGSKLSGPKGLLDEREVQDFRQIFKKAGFHYEDKDPLV